MTRRDFLKALGSAVAVAATSPQLGMGIPRSATKIVPTENVFVKPISMVVEFNPSDDTLLDIFNIAREVGFEASFHPFVRRADRESGEDKDSPLTRG